MDIAVVVKIHTSQPSRVVFCSSRVIVECVYVSFVHDLLVLCMDTLHLVPLAFGWLASMGGLLVSTASVFSCLRI